MNDKGGTMNYEAAEATDFSRRGSFRGSLDLQFIIHRSSFIV
jgi:hypothetical protein